MRCLGLHAIQFAHQVYEDISVSPTVILVKSADQPELFEQEIDKITIFIKSPLHNSPSWSKECMCHGHSYEINQSW